MGIKDDLRHQAGCLDADVESGAINMLHDAADAIEKAERERDILAGGRDHLSRLVEQMRRERDEARALVEDLRAFLAEMPNPHESPFREYYNRSRSVLGESGGEGEMTGDKKLRGLFKQHPLIGDESGRIIEKPHIHGGEPCALFRCDGHCDWLGWIPVRLVEDDEW